MGQSSVPARMIVSPNMMLKKTKTAKELKIEKKIKDLFDNDPLFQFRERLERNNSAQSMTNPNTYNHSSKSHFYNILESLDKRSKEFVNGFQMNGL